MGDDPNAPNYYSPWLRNPGGEGYQQQQYPGYPGYPGTQAPGYPGYPGARAVVAQPVDATPLDIDFSIVMCQVYLWLAFGLTIGFGISYVLGRALLNDLAFYRATGVLTGFAALLLNPVTWIVSMVAWFAIGIGFFPIVQRASLSIGAVFYTIFAAIFGFWTSLVFAEYTSQSIAVAFVVTTGMFAVMSIIGYTTSVDLSQFIMILFMALIGLLIASLVNLFVHNPTLYWVVSYAGVVIFCALTAYDTQRIKKRAAVLARSDSGEGDIEARVALMGAFMLFLDFTNLFLFMVRIGGRSRW